MFQTMACTSGLRKKKDVTSSLLYLYLSSANAIPICFYGLASCQPSVFIPRRQARSVLGQRSVFQSLVKCHYAFYISFVRTKQCISLIIRFPLFGLSVPTDSNKKTSCKNIERLNCCFPSDEL